MAVALKRVYEPPSREDGARVLVDRLWPRGLAKEEAALDAWLKDLAPSHELRQWFHARPQQWSKFREKYLKELSSEAAQRALEELYRLVAKRSRVTLLFASRNREQNNATVLKELIEGKPKPPRGSGPLGAAAGRVRAVRPRPAR